MELIKPSAGDPIIVPLTPIGESLLICFKELRSRLEKPWSHIVLCLQSVARMSDARHSIMTLGSLGRRCLPPETVA